MEVRCKVCKELFNDNPIINLQNMPRGAQVLLNKDEIKEDSGIDLDVYQCPHCGTIQLNCNPVPYYKEVITSGSYSKEMLEFRTYHIRNFVEKFKLTNKRIVEIGCGKGTLLEIIKKVGAVPYGVEASKASVEEIRKNGFSVKLGYVNESFKIDEELFDAFLIINFLEHCPDPSSILRGIYNNLKDGAIGIVEVPSFEQVILNRRFYDFIADHLVYYTQETLRKVLEFNGFEVLETYKTWKDYDIVAVVKKRDKYNLNMLFKDNYVLIERINNFVNRNISLGKKIAIWGASHQALTLIAMAKLENIEYIIDSAKFKQGKYTPVTHYPIVSPDTLYNSKVDTIIVMAAGYSDEVVNIIKNINVNIEIAVLRNENLEIY